jgi:hypothetical protein
MNPKFLKAYISDLELDAPLNDYKALQETPPAETVTPEEEAESKFVNDKSLVSFAAGVSGENQNDLLDSLLLSQLAANKQYSAEDEPEQWFNAFSGVMNNIGWILEESDFSTYKAKGNVIEIESVVMDILESALGGKIIPVAKSLLNAVKGLAEKDSTKFIAFEKNTHSLKKGNFLLGVADETNATLSFSMCMIMMESTHQIKQILFFKSTKDETKIDYSSVKGTLNSLKFADVRPVIEKKLEDLRNDYIAKLDI